MSPIPRFRAACTALGLLCAGAPAGASTTLTVHNQSGGTLALSLPWIGGWWGALPGSAWSSFQLLEHGGWTTVRFHVPDQVLVADLVIRRLGGEGRITLEDLEIQALQPDFVAIQATPLPAPGAAGQPELPSD